jgi:FkbM family methyltransferase
MKNYKGFYVDIGAHHPVRFSNTWMFYKKGWRGINIDPTPGSMRPFRILRHRDFNLEIGIGLESKTATFFCFNEPALNTFDSDLAKERDLTPPYQIIKKIDVPIIPLSEILEKLFPNGHYIDFFTIDVEGLDLQVLMSNDWNKFAPKYILVEDIDFKIQELTNSETYKYLSEVGYEIISVLKRTIIYRKIDK